MSTPASSSAPASTAALANKFLIAGLVGLGLTAVGLFVATPQALALSYLIGVIYWTTVGIGMLLLIQIHYIVDAGWSTVIRRQFEHGLSARSRASHDDCSGLGRSVGSRGHDAGRVVCFRKPAYFFRPRL